MVHSTNTVASDSAIMVELEGPAARATERSSLRVHFLVFAVCCAGVLCAVGLNVSILNGNDVQCVCGCAAGLHISTWRE